MLSFLAMSMAMAMSRRNPFSVIHFTAKPFASIPKYPIPDPKPLNFIVDYLISSFGFSLDKAAKVSKKIAHVKSPEKPDSVRHFLKHHGFTDAQIKTIITWRPEILSSNPENTLEPNLRALREMGLSNSSITQITLSDPRALLHRNAIPRIKFCFDLLGGCEVALVTTFNNNRGLASRDIGPKITLLQTRHGLSIHEVVKVVLQVRRFIISSVGWIEDVLTRAKELGFQPGSAMFVSGLKAVSGNSRVTLQKKLELFRSVGWSKDDFFLALRKSPMMVTVSEKNLQKKLDFLMEEVRCEPSYIASNPRLLIYSLEKRLRPRHHVLRLLESKGLLCKGPNFCSAIFMTDKKFVEMYIQPHKGEITGLHEAYFADCGSESEVVVGKLK